MSSTTQNHSHFLRKSIFSSKTRFLCNAFINLRTRRSNFSCHSRLNSDTFFPVNLEKHQNSTGKAETPQVSVLKRKTELVGIVYGDSCVPGCFYNFLCPKCNGGKSMERSLSFYIVPTGEIAMWRCFRFDCGWADRVYAKEKGFNNRSKKKVKSDGPLTEESLCLKPLGDEVIAYFRERMISEETLHRNKVMQLYEDKIEFPVLMNDQLGTKFNFQPAIAFTYRRQGVLVGCKYRTTIAKRYWQETDTGKVFYGLDDIVDASEVIIVEGELDKLSVEEAGFRNCVSVPGGAPGKISEILPSPETDTAFQYLWNCKEYLDKASRIILATDGDAPGQALAEELARRLGKDRCWKVIWPNKNENGSLKDANEVLRFMGASALKNVILNAEVYPQFMADQQE